MTAADIQEIYNDYADWQSRTAHSKSAPMVRSIMEAIGIAKKNIIDDMSATINHFYKKGNFKTKAEAIAYLSQPIDPQTAELMKASANKIKNKKKREAELYRLNHASLFRERLTNRGALSYIAQNTIADVFDAVNNTMTEGLRSTIKETAARSMFALQKACRAGWSFQMPNKRQLGALIKNIYVPEYAQNIAEGHADTTKNIIIGGVASGMPVDRIAHQITAQSMAELWQAKRLVRTEITKAGNIAEAYAMDSAGIEKYEFSCTLDEKTCAVCGAKDGMTYRLDEATEGLNYPPMHPNCRCWTHPALTADIKRQMTRAHRDPKTGKTDYVPMSMSYKEWANIYLDEVPEEAPADDITTPPVLSIEKGRNTEFKTGVFENAGIDPDIIADLKDTAIRHALPDALDVWNQYNNDLHIADTVNKKGTDRYMQSDRSVYINFKKDMDPGKLNYTFRKHNEDTPIHTKYETIYHELGHNIDHVAYIKLNNNNTTYGHASVVFKSSEFINKKGEGYTLSEMINEEIKEKTDPVLKRIKERTKGIDKYTLEGLNQIKLIETEERDQFYKDYFDDLEFKDTATMSDLTEGVTKGKISYLFGHGKSYWSNKNHLPAEAFAEMYSASMRNDSELSAIKNYIPKSYKIFTELLAAIKRGKL